MGPAHVFRGHAFSIPGTSRACARATPPDLSVLDGPASTDRRVTGRQGLGARGGSKSLAQAPPVAAPRRFCPREPGTPFLTAQVPSTVQAREQVRWAAGSRWRRAPASAGARNFRGRRHLPLLGPRRRGELSEIDARCAEHALEPPLRAPHIHPARPTHGSRTFPPLCTTHAPPCTPRFHLTPFCPCLRRDSMLPFYLDQGRGRCAEAARQRRGGPSGQGGRLSAQGGSWGGAAATSKAAGLGPLNKGHRTGTILFLKLWRVFLCS